VTEAGYVRLHRALLEHPIFTQLTPSVLKVWIGCLLRANWRPSTFYDGSKQVPVPAGAFIFSQETLSKLCAVSRQELRTALHHRKNLDCLTIQTTNRFSLLVIRNWGAYQVDSTVSNHEATREQPQSNHNLTTEEELKNINTPPTPSESEGNGADAPTVLSFPEPLQKNRIANRKPYQNVMEQVARSIHGRHPNADGAAGRRDLGVAGVEKALAAILKHKRTALGDCEAYLRRIDRNHAAACEGESWRKDFGQYVKSLRGWLAAREERYDVVPDPAARKEPTRLMA
jgi:hypothetical protein